MAITNEFQAVRPAPHEYPSQSVRMLHAETDRVRAWDWKPTILALAIVAIGFLVVGYVYSTRSETRELLTQSGVHCVAYRDALTCNWLEFTRAKARAEQQAQELRRLRGPEPPL